MKENPKIEDYDEKKFKELKNRDFVKIANISNYVVTKGVDYSPEVIERECELTMDLLKNNEYKKQSIQKI